MTGYGRRFHSADGHDKSCHDYGGSRQQSAPHVSVPLVERMEWYSLLPTIALIDG